MAQGGTDEPGSDTGAGGDGKNEPLENIISILFNLESLENCTHHGVLGIKCLDLELNGFHNIAHIVSQIRCRFFDD